MTNTAYHMVHYRKFKPSISCSTTFEKMCRSVLDEPNTRGKKLWARINDRVFVVPGSEDRQIVLNRVADLSSAVFGEMCLVESKGLQALLELTETDAELSDVTVAQIYALQERGAPEGSQFIRGIVYWLAVGDHVFFVKTQAMTPSLIHYYFEWLLKIKDGTLPPDCTFLLQAEFDKSQVAGDLGDIRNLRVKGGSAPQFVANTIPDEPPSDVSTSRKIADRFVQFSQAIDVIKALFGPDKAQSLIESLGKDEYLAVDASVKVKGRRTKESKEKLQQLANELADITDGTVQVEGKYGKLSDGDAILRTRMAFNLDHEGSSLLEFNNVADQLQEVYSRFVHDKKITA